MGRVGTQTLRTRGGARGAATALASLAAATLAACAPDFGPAPKLASPAAYDTTKSFDAPASDWPSDTWWTVYGDPQLDALEAEAIKGSPDLRAAEARIRQAAAETEQTGAARLPSLSGDGEIQTTKQSLNEGYPDEFKPLFPHGWHTQTRLALDLDYQLDFFGRNRAALRAAISARRAAEADAAAARLQLTTAVATAYADLARLYADRDAAADALKVRRETLTLIGQRLQNGLETRGVYSQQAETVPVAAGDLDAIDRAIEIDRHQIADLLGEGPDRGLQLSRPAATTLRPLGLPPHLAADLIGRRPDIIAARLRAEAAAQRIKVAKADFYPNVDLTGNYGVQSLGLKYFAEPDSLFGALGPAIRLPIFSAGRLEGAYRGARAEYDAAVASYDKTLGDALKDVADAVTDQRALQVQIKDARAALTSAEDADRIATLRYQGGLSPYLNVLTAENAVLAARRNLADLQAQALADDVALVRALGGGFVEPPRVASAR